MTANQEPNSKPGPQRARTRAGRAAYFILAWLFVALALVGVVIPVLPTTPFLLLAAAFFARSSPRFYGLLVGSRLFGPLIRGWRETGSVPIRAKVSAIGMIVILGGSSVFFFVRPWGLQLGVVGIMLAVSIWLLSLPTRRD